MKTGFVAGSWDLLHAGHIHLLRECKNRCDKLVVGLQVDPSLQRVEKNKPIETLLERQLRLWGCRYVDQVVVYQKENELMFPHNLIIPQVGLVQQIAVK